ncbi:class I SAM-dependent methyltransferase [Histomonas meleagridis]|uniref:class I SAM-dependent methyltransferase n=1 Tax=Histomonas meleagridis TaxID=135588 RepID=UPI003559BEA9|nr:class I SAM-dependent methyltransferase [Histomonas meleagridis]KAH0800969.1 class I SAM-dependent methyltransferase [Histomonas meleagridis]
MKSNTKKHSQFTCEEDEKSIVDKLLSAIGLEGDRNQRIQSAHRLKLIDFWNIPKGARILEIGCGQGDTLAALAFCGGPECFVHGVDIASPDYGAPITLEDAKYRLYNSQLKSNIRIDFEIDITQHPEIYDSDYDIIVLSHSIWYLSSREKLTEILTKLYKPGRRLCIAEWNPNAIIPEQIPHFMATMIQATCGSFDETTSSNIRTLFYPEDILKSVEISGWKVQKSDEIFSSDLQDGKWEVEMTINSSKSLRLPTNQSTLGIAFRYIAFQVYVNSGCDFTITMTIRDDKANRFNFAYSTARRKNQERPSSSQTCALLNLEMKRNHWYTLYFDLELLSQQYWISGTYHILDSVEVSPKCKIRWIYAVDNFLNSHNQITLPNGLDVDFPNGIDSFNLVLPQNIEASLPPIDNPLRKSRIPTRSSTAKSRSSKYPTSVKSESRSKSALTSKKNLKPNTFANVSKPETSTFDAHEEEEDSDCSAFDGVAPKSDIQINYGIPENEEDELELVYIEVLGCYYCPSNQQYYQLDEG